MENFICEPLMRPVFFVVVVNLLLRLAHFLFHQHPVAVTLSPVYPRAILVRAVH